MVVQVREALLLVCEALQRFVYLTQCKYPDQFVLMVEVFDQFKVVAIFGVVCALNKVTAL